MLVLLVGCAAHRHSNPIANADGGRIQFQRHCAACHGEDGLGVEATPPLAGSAWVSGAQERFIKIVLHGVRGSLDVNGKTYDMEMPGFGSVLSDEDAASLLTFVRVHFGAPSEPIAADAVRAARAANQNRQDYWSVSELLEK